MRFCVTFDILYEFNLIVFHYKTILSGESFHEKFYRENKNVHEKDYLR